MTERVMPPMVPPESCLVCKQRITLRGWEPFCCEVCWDSADAEDRRRIPEFVALIDEFMDGNDELMRRLAQGPTP